ncbi:MAG: aminotransferase class I/II-fold pyridoxal phosphate-dependent enzyme, partial [Clostridia bacterium]|nr:aminotransferase class I/II-fold pyridoxal phosphate-dependent enzyme [Clostridia bacterium]
VPLVCDEIHADFVYAPGEHHSILTIEGADECAVMLCAASKTFNVAGLQQSAIVCRNDKMREAIRNEMENGGVKSGNAFALAATRAAYTDCDEWLDGLKAYLMDNRDFTTEYIAKNMPKVKVSPLEATYLMWLDCRALGMEQSELLDQIAAAHVKVNDGTFFGELGRGFIRLNIACPRAQLEKALEAMKTVLG